MEFVGLVIEAMPLHRLEEDAHDTPAAFAFDFHSILSPARDELATWTANVSVVGWTLVL